MMRTSMACTKPSISLTKASPRATAAAPLSCGRDIFHSCCSKSHCERMCSYCVRVSSFQGTNRGRAGSPVRSSSSPSSKRCFSRANSWGDSFCCARIMRSMFMRRRPASLTAAAPPSSCQVTHSVKPMEARATSRNTVPMASSLVDSVGFLRMARV